jgi:hypothetical protein
MLAIQNKKEQPIGTEKKNNIENVTLSTKLFFSKSRKCPFPLTPTGFFADCYRNKML